MNKKITTLITGAIVLISAFSGCTSGEKTTNTDDKLNIVCTTFPQYDWVKQITAGTDNVNLTLLLNSGTDLHSYQPSANDIITISDSDVFIYVGGESDDWVNDVLSSSSGTKTISLMETLGESAKAEELIEGMEAEEHDHGEEHADGEEHDHEEETEYDEHVWLSLKNAQLFCNAICDTLCIADSKNTDAYKANTQAYVNELSALDTEYRTMTDSAARKTVLFGDRFPFRYLVDDYGISYYAAFVGCSAESEASFETIVFLAEKTDELALPYIFVIDSSDDAIAKSIISNTAEKNQEILTLDSMQSVTTTDIENGTSYLEIMKTNLNALKKALN